MLKFGCSHHRSCWTRASIRVSAEALIVTSRSRVLTQFSCAIHEPRLTVVRRVVSVPQLRHSYAKAKLKEIVSVCPRDFTATTQLLSQWPSVRVYLCKLGPVRLCKVISIPTRYRFITPLMFFFF
ncbi:hypothetical protein IscW_ISCW010482 [Ixodes scapularis]|uniref:Uncharacterized protein n=1 Tax=Ixodes scapularis TaxID=6945 RepID=B7Q5W8_IXOSC|nr:hypothetical protein IscW_ISCW010482 [Ixodes scapularis]|eukprot:XP_002402373.1 hypothetical protein IscW_ISCW010482 [Ixodes scapularis]